MFRAPQHDRRRRGERVVADAGIAVCTARTSGGWVWRRSAICGGAAVEETRRPPALPAARRPRHAQLSAKCILALVIPT